VIQELLNICRLDARHMVGSGFPPIPVACPSRKELGVFEMPPTFNFEAAPRIVHDSRGTGCGLHSTYLP
jgi:hypothetical protein